MADKPERKNYELTVLNQIAEALNRSVDLDEAVQATLAQVAHLLDVQAGWVWLLDEESNAPYLAANQALPPALANKPSRMEGGCYCLDSFRDGDLEGAANVNVIECTRLHGLVDGTDGLRYHASIPLYVHGKKLGVLNVASTDWRELSDDDLRLLYTVGDLLGIAIERARLYEKSVQLGAVEERNRLAREIHDTLAQSISAVALQLESADALLEEKAADKAHFAVQKALQLTRENIEEIRRSVLDLRAAPLEGKRLAEALAAMIDNLQAQWDLTINYSVAGGNTPLPVRVEAGLYRIAQEALTNVWRHAGAELAQVSLVVTPERAQLVVADNGRGFDAEQVFGERFGLIGLNERTRLLGGVLRLESEVGQGTRVQVTIPLQGETL
jgi:two-component system NarL family sensor kinase